MRSRQSLLVNHHTPSSRRAPIFSWRNNTTRSTPKLPRSTHCLPVVDPSPPHPPTAAPPTPHLPINSSHLRTMAVRVVLHPATTTATGAVEVAVAVGVAAAVAVIAVNSSSIKVVPMPADHQPGLPASIHVPEWSRHGRCPSAPLPPVFLDLDLARHRTKRTLLPSHSWSFIINLPRWLQTSGISRHSWLL